MHLTCISLFFFSAVCVIQLLCVGPSGAGKTLTMTNKLMRSMPAEFSTHAFMFSASTSASQTQDFFESKLSKR